MSAPRVTLRLTISQARALRLMASEIAEHPELNQVFQTAAARRCARGAYESLQRAIDRAAERGTLPPRRERAAFPR